MESLQNAFSKVEYLTIFGTFVYGYVATQFFSGWGALISQRKEISFSKEHLAWTILTFLLLIDVWWGSWLKGLTISRHRLFFYLSLVSPIIFYIISILHFPSLNQLKNLDLRNYFDTIRVRNYTIYIILLISFYFNDFFLQKAPMSDYLLNSIAVVLALFGLIFRKKWIDRILIALGLITVIVHMFTQVSFKADQNSIENFSVTEYLTIFAAFIYGAVAIKFFEGWGSLFSNIKRIKMDNEYLLWTFFSFGLLIDLWWGQWAREPFIARDIGTFILSLSTPIVCYFTSVVIFPVFREKDIDLTQFYLRNRKTIYFLVGLILATNFIVANLLEETYIFSQINILRISAVVMACTGIYFESRSFQKVVLVLAWGLLVFHALAPGQ